MIKRITQITLLPEGGNIFDENIFVLTVDDEAAGEYIRVQCENDNSKPGEIAIDPGEWPILRDTLNEMFNSLRKDD
jgi:hypothetical protein